MLILSIFLVSPKFRKRDILAKGVAAHLTPYCNDQLKIYSGYFHCITRSVICKPFSAPGSVIVRLGKLLADLV